MSISYLFFEIILSFVLSSMHMCTRRRDNCLIRASDAKISILDKVSGRQPGSEKLAVLK